jgi:hypothetical protein
MRVFVVVCDDGSVSFVVGVYSTLEKAMEVSSQNDAYYWNESVLED